MQDSPSRTDALKHIRQQLDGDEQIVPSLPQVLVRVQKAIDDKEIGARDLANVILDDPSLTASVLRLANSAYFRHTRAKIRTVTSAIILLGFETVRNLALGLSVYNMLSNLPKIRNYQQLWRHSLCCGVCAKRLAELMGLQVPEEAFVAGLLHDLGKFVLGQFFPEQYAMVLEAVGHDDTTFLAAERKILKCDHMEIGRMAVERWNFPEDIAEAIANHELDFPEDGLLPETPSLVKCVILANKIAHYLYREEHPGQSMVTSAEIQELCSGGLQLDDEQMQQVADIIDHLQTEVHDVAHILDIVIDDWRYESLDGTENTRAPATGEGSAPADERLSFLLFANQLAGSADSLLDFIRLTAERMHAALQLSHVFLLTHNRQKDALEAAFGFGNGIEGLREKISIATTTRDDVASRAFLQRSPIVVNADNMQLFSRLSESNLVSLLGTFHIAALPVFLDERVASVLVVARPPQGDPLRTEDIGVISIYTQTLASVLSHTRGATDRLRKNQSTKALPAEDIRKAKTSVFRKSDLTGGTE